MTQASFRQGSRPQFSLFVVLLAGGILAGCAGCTTPAPEPVPIPETSAPPEVEPTPEPEPAGPPIDVDGVWLDPDGRPLSRTLYFDFDQAVLRPRDLRTLERHADFLRANRNRSIMVEGHCDERGTREYNLALGERRSNAVRSFLMSDGVRDGQIETVSYGEERPVDVGHDEAAWGKNRRAELIYR